MLKTAAASNLFSTVIGEKRRGSGTPTTEGSRWMFDVLDLSGCYTASSPRRRAFLLVGVGAFDDPLLSVILLKASPFRRGCFTTFSVKFAKQTYGA